MANTGQLQADMLFLGLTRPPMLFGVSYTVVIFYFFLCMIYFVLSSDLKAFLAMPLFHGAAYFASAKEPLFFDLFMIRQQKCNRCKNRWYHGMANSYDVF